MKITTKKDLNNYYANKLDKLDEIDKFIERHKVLKVTLEGIENLPKLKINKEIGLIVKKLSH